MRCMCRLFAAMAIMFVVPAWAHVQIDGHISPGEWQGARHIVDFRQTQPLTGKTATMQTQAWILSTPEGLAVAFRNTQPPGVARTEQRVQRDFDDQVDRDNLMIDFNGDGRNGYDFTVSSTGGVYDGTITNETNFNKDWDGSWQHAASQDARGWTVEMLIPWYTAPMQKAHGDTRTLHIYLDRVVGSTGERDAWPVASFRRTRFVSDFRSIQVPRYSQTLLAVTPYVSGLHDNVHGRSQFKEGADLLWKPSGQFQLTATINPDFGQVESDDLVVNFGATETYFSDKRPFFTENQGIFDFSLLDDNSQLVYTRRVGGPADDGHGTSDIRAAVKLNGSIGATNYGVLAADEDGPAGRTFGAARVTHEFGTQTVGALLTRVQHPFLDRQATVLGLDDHWHPTQRFTLQGNVVGSDIAQHGQITRGAGATAIADERMGNGWRQQWLVMHFDDRLQINDFGYLERNNFDYAHWEVRKRITDLPAGSIYSSHDWHFRVDALDNDDHGLRLRRQLRINRSSELRNGDSEDAQIDINSAGWDDLLTRGHGALFLPPSSDLYYEHVTPRHGNWSWKLDAQASTGGLAGNRRIGYDLDVVPTYFVSNALSIYTGVEAQYTPGWLVWQHDNLIGSFNQRTVELKAGFDWNIDGRQQLRLKLQALGLDARVLQAYRVGANGRAMETDDPVKSFNVRNLGLQIRYRYELAPLSYLYVVYGRGGYAQNAYQRDTTTLLRNSFALRDDDELLVKLDYRFEL